MQGLDLKEEVKIPISHINEMEFLVKNINKKKQKNLLFKK